MYMPNVNPTLAYPTRTIFHWLRVGVYRLALGIYRLALGIYRLVLGIYRLALGIIGSHWVHKGFSDTNMLVSPTRKSRIGEITQREDPTRESLRCGVI